MIAVTQISLQKIFLGRRRPAVSDASASSGFGSNVTYVVGSVATRVGVRPPSAPAGAGEVEARSATPVTSLAPHRAVESSLKPGKQLGPFRLLRLLGQGAQGDVWKAKRIEPCVEIVALKVLNPT